MKRFFLSVFLLVVSALACVAAPETPAVVTVAPQGFPTETPIAQAAPGEPIPLQVGYGYRGSFYEVYFSDPFNPASKKEEGGIDIPLARAIDNARISVDLAVYSMSLNSIRESLLNAHRRGV
mgnify:CR=1 FL=1